MPNARVFSSERRDLAWSADAFGLLTTFANAWFSQ